DPEVDPGTAPDPVSEADVAKDDATGEAVAAQQADPVDAATQDVTPAGETAIETQAETPAEDPGAGTGAPETAPESPVAEDPETGPPGSVSPAPAQTVDSAGLPEGAETDAGEPATPEGAAETGTVTDDLDATAIPEGVGEDEISPATQSAETTSPQGPDETAAIDPDSATEVPGAEDAGDAAAAVEDPVSTEPEIADAEAGAEAENRETPSSEAGEAALNFSLDIPAIRPRARPPLVVHPDLAGVRPKPRPAEIPAVTPAAPTTE
ncbi:MAG: hypothetical protein KDK53_12645, partial [Maritimibacter sp.]|nr:hypothetical protein [Maritimibacter sp.]